METLNDSIKEYQNLLKNGNIQKAYKGLMDYIMELRTHFERNLPKYSVSGSIYPGYMDMTYFSVIPESLKKRSLKIAIVFIHELCRFEVWLSGYNKQVQAKYWDLIKESKWDKYHLVPSIKGVDSILESVLVENPDFNDSKSLTSQIEQGTLSFIDDIECFLSQH